MWVDDGQTLGQQQVYVCTVCRLRQSNPPGRVCRTCVQVSGLVYSYNGSSPAGSLILSASVKTAAGTLQPIDPCKNYTTVVNDYMAGAWVFHFMYSFLDIRRFPGLLVLLVLNPVPWSTEATVLTIMLMMSPYYSCTGLYLFVT